MKHELTISSIQAAEAETSFPATELFNLSSTAVLVASESTGRIAIANPAALALLGLERSTIIGWDWRAAFHAESAPELTDAAQRAASAGVSMPLTVVGAANSTPLTLHLSRFCMARAAYLLIRLTALAGTLLMGAVNPASAIEGPLFAQLDSIAAPFVLTDGALYVEFANRAFCDLLGGVQPASLEHQSLLRWLNFGPAELERMHRQMSQREATSTIVTTLFAGPTLLPTVEVIAIAVADRSHPRWGFILRTETAFAAASRAPVRG